MMKRLISGALLLTLAGIISKILSAMYRIPLQNLTGDIGFYTYQQIYPIIATVMILSLYGFPVAVSRLTKEQLINGKQVNHRSYILTVFSILLIISMVFAFIIFLSAPILAYFMNDQQMVLPLKISAFLFLFIPFLSLFRGLFQSQLQVEETAYSQIVEQFIRVGIIIVGAWLIYEGTFNVRSIAEIGVLASVISMLITSVLHFMLFIHRYPISSSIHKDQMAINWRSFTKTLIIFGLIASLNHLTLIFIQFIDTITIVPQLMKMGLSKLEAMEQKGIFDRGIPLIQIGVVLGSSFALLFVPSLTENKHHKNLESVQDAFSISVYLAVGATVGIIVLFPEVNRLLFMNDQQTTVLQILALSILLLSISITGSAILQAFNYVNFAILSLVISIVTKFLLNYILIPEWGTYGSAIATVCSLLLLTILVILGIYKKLHFSPLKFIHFSPLLLSSSTMMLYLLIIKWLVKADEFSRLSLFFYVIFLVLTSAFVYIIMLIRLKALNKRQLVAIPFRKLWLTIYKYVNN